MGEIFYARISDRLLQLESDGMLRTLRYGDYGVPIMTDGARKYLNLSSNDYLGIANGQALYGGFLAGVKDGRFGSAGSRLMTGNSTAYADFEMELEGAYSRPALVFGSGYHANTGVLPALVSPGDLVLADRLVHASIIDGILSSKAVFVRYRHNDLSHLESLLEKERKRYDNVWIVSESIFSMDGDRSDLCALAGLKQKYDALLYIDEAHSIGTDGPGGLGTCFAQGMDAVDIAVFPMGKAMASHGAFVVCREEVKQYLVNTSRPMIFSTALPPICVEWSAFVLREIQAMDAQRERLVAISKKLRQRLLEMGYRALGDSHIIPIVFGENEVALRAAQILRREGIWATAIRHPTVPKGQARIRLSLSSVFSSQDMGWVETAFTILKRELKGSI